MGPISISFDVTDALPPEVSAGNRISIAAWLFLPDDLHKLGAKPVVMTLLSGGSYDKRYFHCEIPGHAGYSAAEHLAALGNIVLVPDHLGVGDSSKAVDQKQASRQIVALAGHAAMKQCYQRLRLGSLHLALPAIADFVKVGVGHSMGGMLLITQQAEHATYDAVMILGYALLGAHLTINGKVIRADASRGNESPDDYMQGSREFLRETFHWHDVPPDIVAFDDSLAVPTPSRIGMEALQSSRVALDAARIEAPVFLCMGERDVSPDAWTEPAFYRRSRDISLRVLPQSGHCHNFATTRRQLWDRMHRWAGPVAG